MFRSEMTSPLSERNWDQTDVFREGRQEASENDLLLKMQRKMTGLDSKQKKVIKEYETELDAMRNEIKMIKSSYDHLKQKNARYRHHLKDRTELVKKLQEEQARMVKAQGVETSWSSEKTKLLAKLKQLEVEKKQVEDQYRSLLNVKDENVKLTSEVESLRFKETLWTQEREKMERKRRQGREPDTHHPVDRGPNTIQTGSLMSSSLKFGLSSGEFNFDDAWNHITNSTHLTSTPDKSLFSSLPITGGGGSTASASYSSRTAKDTPTNKDGRHSSARHPLRRTRSDFQESSDLQDIRKSLNEAREELMRSTSNIDIELESARSARQAKSDSQSKKDQFLQELRAREEMNTVHGMTHQRDADANEVRSMICSMEAKIASLETNCLSEVQNLVSNVDILKNELLNTQQELQYLKEYSKKVETQREQEKIQLMNESRELKLDLSSLRTEIRDKSEASDRTDASRSVFSDSREQEENFDKHYSPLVGFVGSRCDYLKIKLDTLKKHLKNLDLQTKTVLNQSLTSSDDGRQGDELQQPSPEKSRKIPKSKAPDSSVTPTSIKRLKKSGGRGSGSSGSSGRGSGGRGGNDGSKSDRSETNDKRRRSSGMGVNNGSGDNGSGDNSDKSKKTGGDDGGDDSKMDFIDDDEIFVLTPRPHRNKYEEDMDLLIVENGQNIERLRLPSLEEEEDEDGDDDDDDDDEEDDETMENSDEDGDDTDKMSTERGSARSEIGTPRDGTGRRRVLESPRLSDRSSARLDDDEIVSKYLVNEETRTSSLAHQVDTHFELLEKELARRERRRTSKGPPPMQADHRLFSNTRSKH